MDTRSTSEGHPDDKTIARASQDVYLPRWVNEPLPELLGLAVLGRFPKQRTHCGKPVGWHRADVLDWLTQNMAIEDDCKVEARTCRSAKPRQACLPLEMDATHHPVCIPQRRHATGGNRS